MAYMSMQVLPSGPLLEEVDSYMSVIALRINVNNEESSTLTALRDTLPPKLISGELPTGTLLGHEIGRTR